MIQPWFFEDRLVELHFEFKKGKVEHQGVVIAQLARSIGRSKMCYETKCSTCGKTTWGGCGRHVASVYKRVPEGQRCNCQDWPGVKAGDDAADENEPSSICAIL
ncbi:hypothetical protein CJ030_MR3G009902 [Morella rubra]|uniref:Uncharacterized protein n=1 Tax=Morella rubra TaxID=262757 RepID=A0A6A1W5B9_9ROSI|nr:hypothetical protein CJ030_MR3G009902 [Morella rubra]